MTTFEQVRDIIANQMRLDPNEVKPESNIKGDMKADSLDIAEILFTIEDDFGIEVPTDRALAIETIEQLVALIDELKA